MSDYWPDDPAIRKFRKEWLKKGIAELNPRMRSPRKRAVAAVASC